MKKCIKCGYENETNKEKFGLVLCNICHRFAPNDQNEFKQYVQEKTNSENLEVFRKYAKPVGENQKQGMIEKAEKGELMSRAPFGYNIEKGRLIPAVNSEEVREIFEEFLNTNQSLRKIAEKYKFSVNGLKKILTNFTYIGKIKFNGQIHQGNHQPLISSTLFNHVQNKLSNLGINKEN